MNTDRMRRWHARDKAVIDHLADKAFEPSPDAKRQSPTTATGLSVQKQVRKKWDRKRRGLPVFYPTSN